MALFLAPIINEQQEDANGAPLSGGTVEVYLAGTSTPVSTFSDKAGLVANTWPIVLNTLGVNNQGAVWITGGSAYKFIIKDSTGVVQRTIDNVSGINDSAAAADQWVVYAGTPTFVSANSFTVPGDQTQTFSFGTRLRTVNTAGVIYATVVRSVFSGSATTVTVLTDSGALDVGLSAVSTGLVTAQNPSIPGTVALPPFRNRVINGAFHIDQRNNGGPQTITAGASPVYTMDRFYVSCTGVNISAQRALGTGYRNAFTLTGAISNTGTLFGQRIESVNVYDWIGRQIYVQVPISSVGVTSLTWNVYTADVIDNFSAKTLIATGTLPLAPGVETKFFTFNAGPNAGRGIAIEFVSGPLTGGQTIVYQGAFQAEAGQVTSFEAVEIGDDLRRCQRYMEAFSIGALDCISSNFQAGQNNTYTVPLKVTKRAIPSISAAWTQTNVSAVTPAIQDPSNITVNAANTAAGQWRITNSTIALVYAEL